MTIREIEAKGRHQAWVTGPGAVRSGKTSSEWAMRREASRTDLGALDIRRREGEAGATREPEKGQFSGAASAESCEVKK